MTIPQLEPLLLSDHERQVLQGWAQQRTAQAQVLRSRIVLTCAGGAPVSVVASELGIARATAAKWRSRFLRDRLIGLSDEPRPGRPRVISDEQVQNVITATLNQRPPAGDARWSTRSMARQAGLSQTAISRIWRAFGLSPHPAYSKRGPAAPATAGGSTGDTLPLGHKSINESNHQTGGPPDRPGLAGRRVKPGGNTVLAAERRDLLLARLRRDGKLVARDLAAELGLSEDSLRRDLRELAAAGLCQRVYGGALPVSPAAGTTLTARTEIAPDSKRRVAAAAARLITPGTTVILEGGTTALQVVAALPPDLDARIITHSASTAVALANHPTVTGFLLGGELHKQSVSASGAATAEAASRITADLALLTIPGIHPREGLTTSTPDDAALKRILTSRAADTYVMASTEKLGTVCAYTVTSLSEVAGIITDTPAGHPAIEQLRRQGATIIPAP
jgi:DeoR/GlpR family transcriptional regulator of sugar metabolism/transposase